MLKGLWKLTWVEIKVFIREPMGVVGSLALPVILFIFLGRSMGTGREGMPMADEPPFNVTILAALFIAIGTVLSLVAIISIYREGGILKRLRATPLSPVTILGAHVLVKLIFTVIGLGLLFLAGRQFFPGAMRVDMISFTAALLLSTLSILSLGFIVASIVPTARFARPLGAAILYPMLAVSGLFFPIEQLPPLVQYITFALPTTHAVVLMQGIWDGHGWGPYLGNVLALIAVFGFCTGLSSRMFRWE